MDIIGIGCNMNELSEAEIKRMLSLRAIEWTALPAFISQPLVPVLFIFFPWLWVVCGIILLGILWCPIRYLFVNIRIATFACFFVTWLKWPAAIGSSIYLFLHDQPLTAVIALLWPLLGGLIGIPGKIGIIEHKFAKEIGFIPPWA